MENTEVILTAIAQLGIAGIFVWLYIGKDKQTCELQEKLLTVITRQTEMNGELKGVIEKNTAVADRTLTVTERVYDELIKTRNKQ